MAEAIALLGAVAAGAQCAQVGGQILLLGWSLRSKLQAAPDQVKGWLGQIEQLVALAELMKEPDSDLSQSVLRLPSPQSSSPARTAATWVEAALLECTAQASTLTDVLKDMLQEVDDGKGRKIWKTILTVKREREITSALQEIERQKSMLNMWLGQNNLRQLDHLHRTVKEVRDGVGKVECNMLHVQQTFRQELQGLSTALNSSSEATTSGFEILRNHSTSSTDTIRQQIQQYYGELQSESLVTQSQLRSLVRTLRSKLHESKTLTFKDAGNEGYKVRIPKTRSV